ncbi:SIR2 family NAD-dependent protein deacylase [Nitrosophilus alvini]|uniref:SIR2 family NAD-dependent protein deacylase n=1 Tax=Nitrosophilus alvini TaxID=2714855 RepID=UPI00190C3D77|nr:Sir2 family NAD-dependent protein deacetylase [Nitrosophilus alvini]
MESIVKAAEEIKRAEYLLITAGAGMGVDSGLPDFRGKEGFWRAYPPIARLGVSFEEMANPTWFFDDPHLAWAFYGHRLNLYRKTEPHEGFYKLLSIAKSKKDYFVFTSNVDGQFQKAGFDRYKIEECHGSIHHLQCIHPCCDNIWSAEDVEVRIDEEKFRALDPLPYCRYCGDVARPNILMFGDWNWVSDRTDMQAERFNEFLQKVKSLVIIEIGAGTAVATVRMLSERVSKMYSAPLIRINPRDYEGPEETISIKEGAKSAISKIYELL